MCLHLAMSNYLEGKGGEVKRIHDEAQLVPRLLQKVFQPLIPQTLHIWPHHPYRRAGIHCYHKHTHKRMHTPLRKRNFSMIPNILKSLPDPAIRNFTGGDWEKQECVRQLKINVLKMCPLWGLGKRVQSNQDLCLCLFVTKWDVINSKCTAGIIKRGTAA